MSIFHNRPKPSPFVYWTVGIGLALSVAAVAGTTALPAPQHTLTHEVVEG